MVLSLEGFSNVDNYMNMQKKKFSFVCEELLWTINNHFSFYFILNFMQGGTEKLKVLRIF